MFEKIYQLFEEELSGINAKTIATNIFPFDRSCSFSKYAESAKYCCELLKSIGLEDAKIWDFPADGKMIYGDRRMPKAWDGEEGELRIVEPASAAEILASYRDEPLSLAMHSSSTPEEGVEAELVYIEDASKDANYENVDVTGKVVFTGVHVSAAKLAHDKGAVGLISDYMPTFDTARETPMDLAEGRVWSRIDPEANCFAFVLTPRQGVNLRALLKNVEKVKVRATVKAKSYDGTLKLVDALIPGQNRDEEFLIIAHLFEPGANDNASGSALAVEIARTIQTLIKAGKLSQPRRSIRVLLTYEFMSAMAYACTQPDTVKRMFGGINPDMVGEDQSLCMSALTYHTVPDACCSYLMYFAHRLFAYHEKSMTNPQHGRRYRLFWCLPAKYDGNDCIISDPSIGVPSIQITQWPDKFYHTSLDTPDKISEFSMKKSGVLVGTFAYFLANAGARETIWLMDQVCIQAEQNMIETADRMLLRKCGEIGNSDSSAQEKSDVGSPTARKKKEEFAEVGVAIGKKLDYLALRDGDAIASAARLAGDDAAAAKYAKQLRRRLKDSANKYKRNAVNSIAAHASGYGVEELAAPKSEEPKAGAEEAAKIIPERIIIGPLSFVTLPEEGKKNHTEVRKGIPGSFVQWINGKRNLLEIAGLLEQENDVTVDVEQLIKYCKFLEEHGYIKIKS